MKTESSAHGGDRIAPHTPTECAIEGPLTFPYPRFLMLPGPNPITGATIQAAGPHYDSRFHPSKVLADDGDDWTTNQGGIWLTPSHQNSWFVMDLGDSYSVTK